MLYIVAFLLPPLAVLLAGKPLQALINLLVCAAAFFFWPLILLAWILAFVAVADTNANRRTKKIIKAVENSPK